MRIITDLESVEVEISDEDQVILLLMSLSKQFDQLRDTLMYGKQTVTLDEVMNSIHSKQLELGSSGKVNKAQGEVLYSNNDGFKGKNTQKHAYRRTSLFRRKSVNGMFSLGRYAVEKDILKEIVLREVIRKTEIFLKEGRVVYGYRG